MTQTKSQAVFVCLVTSINPKPIILVESMGGIIHRTSVLDLDVRVSLHPAPDNS